MRVESWEKQVTGGMAPARVPTDAGKIPVRMILIDLLVGLLGLSSSGQAATITVTSGADGGGSCPNVANCTLRDAITAAAPGDTINFAAGVPTVTLTSAGLSINKNLTIDGGAGVTVTRQAASPPFGIFLIPNNAATVALNRLAITNGVGNEGVGVTNVGILTLTDSTVSGNVCTGDSILGCGIRNIGTMRLVGSTVSGNAAVATGQSAGGGIFNAAAMLTLINSTVSGNSITGGSLNFGGGICNYFLGSRLVMINSTVTGNSASGSFPLGGGILNDSPSDMIVGNTVIAGNTGTGPDFYGAFQSAGYNIVGNTSNTTVNGVLAGNQLDVAPLLAPLGGNGGPTQTHALLPGSPTINAGSAVSEIQGITVAGVAGTFTVTFNGQTTGLLAFNATGAQVQAALAGLSTIGAGNIVVSASGGSYFLFFVGTLAGTNQPSVTAVGLGGATAQVQNYLDGGSVTTDQRGISRPQQGTPDIGAFESQGFSVALSSGNNQSAIINTNFANPLAVTVSSAFSEPVNGGRVMFTPPGAGASATLAGNPATITGGTATLGTVTANGTVGGPYNVTATATGASNLIFNLTNLPLQADLGITKTDGVTTATPGGSVTYTITAANAGPSSVTGATVADTFPASLTCTWTCVGAGGGTCTAAGSGNINDTVNLPVGGSTTYTASCTIAATATGTLSNTATVASGVADPTPANNSATDSNTLIQLATLAIQLDAPGSAPTAFNFTTVGGLTPTAFSLQHGQTQTFTNLIPGQSYTINDQPPPPGWVLDEVLCSALSPACVTGSITLTPTEGQTVTGTFRFLRVAGGVESIPVFSVWGLGALIGLFGLALARLRRRV